MPEYCFFLCRYHHFNHRESIILTQSCKNSSDRETRTRPVKLWKRSRRHSTTRTRQLTLRARLVFTFSINHLEFVPENVTPFVVNAENYDEESLLSTRSCILNDKYDCAIIRWNMSAESINSGSCRFRLSLLGEILRELYPPNQFRFANIWKMW